MVYLTRKTWLHHSPMHRIPADRLPDAQESKQTLRKSKFPGYRQICGGTQAFSLAVSKQMLSIPAPFSLSANRRLAPGAFPGLPTISPDIIMIIDRLELHLTSPEAPQAEAQRQTVATLRQSP